MFDAFLFALRAQGLVIGSGEWLGFLDALKRGLAVDLDELYVLGRALLCRAESEFDKYDLAFAATFRGAVLPEQARSNLEQWLADALKTEGPRVDHGMDPQELWKELLKRLAEQQERHDGGNYWVGTGGTSPFGHSGRAAQGIRIGGSGGGRGAVQVAMDRQWETYRTDRVLDVRDLQVALRALRALRRDGVQELDLDGTIEATCRNGGDIELVERRARRNQVHLVLLMDAGGSMAPHYEKVSRLFSAATRVKTFRSFEALYFHNCVYGWLWRDFRQHDRVRTEAVLQKLGPKHRVIVVGDASMAPYELFSTFSWPGEGGLAGLEWLQRLRARCPGSAWLNPDPRRYWDHPTVSAIGRIFPMHELTVDGLRDAIRTLRAPL